MDSGRGSSIGFAMMTWVGLVGAEVPAAAPERGYSLEYRGTMGCPDAAVLAQAIETRTPGARQEPRDRAAVRLRVELREDGTSALWIDLPEGGSNREFPQAACADMVASIAVIASMVLEADAPERAATTQALIAHFEPLATPPAAPVPDAPPAAPVEPPSPPSPPSTRSVATPAAPSPKRTRARIAFSAGALFESAVANDAALGGSAGIAAWLEPGTSRIWRPRLHAELLGTVPSTVEAEQGDVEMQLLVGRLHVCPLSQPVSTMLRLVPCFAAKGALVAGPGAQDGES